MKKLLIAVLISLFAFNLSLQPALAQTKEWGALEAELGVGRCVSDQGVATIQGVACLIANVLSVSLALIGLAGFVMLIIGSLRWMTSGGNSQNVDKSKKTMTFAIVGLVLALSSYMIINLIAQFTGVNVITEFIIPSSEIGLPGSEYTQWEDFK